MKDVFTLEISLPLITRTSVAAVVARIPRTRHAPEETPPNVTPLTVLFVIAEDIVDAPELRKDIKAASK